MNSKEKMTPDEKWNNATLANNFIFYKVIKNAQWAEISKKKEKI
ncbi:hypothetical protein [Treponema sp.]|nr:hypothetical protein [Treponema sp.]